MRSLAVKKDKLTFTSRAVTVCLSHFQWTVLESSRCF